MKIGDKIVWIASTREGRCETGTVIALAHQEDGEFAYVYVDDCRQTLCDFIYSKYCYPIERKPELRLALKKVANAAKALEKANALLNSIPKE